MSNNNNQMNIPQAREAGSVGGQMVKKMGPVGNTKFDRKIRTALGHIRTVEYIAYLTREFMPRFISNRGVSSYMISHMRSLTSAGYLSSQQGALPHLVYHQAKRPTIHASIDCGAFSYFIITYAWYSSRNAPSFFSCARSTSVLMALAFSPVATLWAAAVPAA